MISFTFPYHSPRVIVFINLSFNCDCINFSFLCLQLVLLKHQSHRDPLPMAVSPDIRPLPPLPCEPPSHQFRIPNSQVTLPLPTTDFTIYSMVTQNYIASSMRLRFSKLPTEPSKNCEPDKNGTCWINSNLRCEMDCMGDSRLWSYNKEKRPFLLMPWTDPIHEIIDLYFR